jgi:hypothetical protein
MIEREHREQAEAELARAAQQLWELRRLALFGECDSEEFDRAIAYYRTAAHAAREARAGVSGNETAPPASATRESTRLGLQVPPAFVRAFAGAAEAPPAPPAPVIPARPPAPLVPPPRMQFVKWLVATGRLSD